MQSVKTKEYIFKPREAYFETVGPILVIDIESKEGKHLGHLQFEPHHEERKVVRMDDSFIKDEHRIKNKKTGESPIMIGMRIGMEWGHENGFTHLERGHKSEDTLNRIKISPKKKPTSSSARRPR